RPSRLEWRWTWRPLVRWRRLVRGWWRRRVRRAALLDQCGELRGRDVVSGFTAAGRRGRRGRWRRTAERWLRRNDGFRDEWRRRNPRWGRHRRVRRRRS